MGKIIVWNSIATRMRSPSDGLLENGLATLRAHLKTRGHTLEVVDWQKDTFYDGLCPAWLRALNRASTGLIFKLGGKRKIYAKLYFPVFNAIQETVTLVRKGRMRKRLARLGDDVVKSGVKLLGVKIWYGEAFEWSDWLVRYINKRDPSILTVAGGFHTTLYEDDLLKNSVFDLGVSGEGEKALEIIMDIADGLAGSWDKNLALSEIKRRIDAGELKNTVYRDGDSVRVSARYETDMRNKVSPAYAVSDIEGKLRIHVLLDSLGCPWGRCSFCVHHHIYPQFVPRPIEAVINEIRYMIGNGVGLFKLAGSETPPDFGARIAKAVIDSGLKIKYTMGCRAVSGIAESSEKYARIVEDFRTMLRSGLRAIFMGGESGNDVINEKIMNKGVSAADIIETARAYREAQKSTGIPAYLSLALIYPSPVCDGITDEIVCKDNLSLVDAMKPDSVIVSPCTPFKHTQWHDHMEQYGFNVGSDFLDRLIRYEYVLYKPPSMWPPLGVAEMRGKGFARLLEECGDFRKEIEKRGIPADLTDEFYMILEAAGYKGMDGIMRFKKETSVDLVSSDYRNIDKIKRLTNITSKQIADSNGE